MFIYIYNSKYNISQENNHLDLNNDNQLSPISYKLIDKTTNKNKNYTIYKFQSSSKCENVYEYKIINHINNEIKNNINQQINIKKKINYDKILYRALKKKNILYLSKKHNIIPDYQ